jgi:hypothetical protein
VGQYSIGLNRPDLQVLGSAQFAALGTSGFAALSTANLSYLSNAAVSVITTSQLRALSTSRLDALGTSQFAALSGAQVSALSTAQIAGLETVDFKVLSSAAIAALSNAQIAALTTGLVVAISTAQMGYLRTDQVRALSTAQIRALQTMDLKVMSTRQIASLSTSQLSALSTAQISAFSKAQKSVAMTASGGKVTPIVLDLNGDGVQTLSLSHNTAFDIMAMGQKIKTGWVSASDGLLAMDRNHDGLINDGSELFGSATRLADGSSAQDGYQALAQLDSNHDGRIDKEDTAFGALGVWVDANSDAVSQSAEIHTLASLGIASLSLKTTAGDALNQGNILGLNSSYQSSDGISHAAADVWFAVAPADSLAPKVGALTQAIGAFDAGSAAAASPTGKAPSAGSSENAALASPVLSLVQAMQSFNALSGRGASATTELRYSAPPSAQLALLEPGNQRQADSMGFLGNSGAAR